METFYVKWMICVFNIKLSAYLNTRYVLKMSSLINTERLEGKPLPVLFEQLALENLF